MHKNKLHERTHNEDKGLFLEKTGYYFCKGVMFEGFLFLLQTEQLHTFVILEEPQMMHISPPALFQEFLSKLRISKEEF